MVVLLLCFVLTKKYMKEEWKIFTELYIFSEKY